MSGTWMMLEDQLDSRLPSLQAAWMANLDCSSIFFTLVSSVQTDPSFILVEFNCFKNGVFGDGGECVL